MKLVRLIKNVLKRNVCRGKHLSDSFPIQNGLKEGDTLSPLLLNFALEHAIRPAHENKTSDRFRDILKVT
jgi:hypothetical protein